MLLSNKHQRLSPRVIERIETGSFTIASTLPQSDYGTPPSRLELANGSHHVTSRGVESDDISVNQFIASAAAEKMASVLTLDFLKAEAAKGQHSDFEHFMSLIPDTPAQPGDETA